MELMPYANYPTIQHAWFNEVWNQANEAAIDDLCAEDVVGHGLTDANGNEVDSREGFRSFYRAFRSAFPDIHVDVLETATEGDNVVARCRVRATHTGQGFVIPPTGAVVDFTGMCWIKVRNGQISESWNSFDFLKVMQQLGAV
jgi:steroid delta-isomerase-like uncharacterized protein